MVTLIGSNERNNTLTLFLSIDGYELVQMTFKWHEDRWSYKDCVKRMDFRMKKEEKSVEEQIEEMKRQSEKGMALMDELLFGKSKDK